MAVSIQDLLLGYSELEKVNRLDTLCDQEILRRFEGVDQELAISLGRVVELSEKVVEAVAKRYNKLGWQVRVQPGSTDTIELVLKALSA